MENPKTTQQSEGWTTQKREAIRKYFTFYRSFRDALYKVPKQRRLVLYEAIADYALDGIEPSVECMGTVESMVWDLMLPNLLASRKRFLNGTKGGAPKGNNNNPLGNNQWTTNGQPMDNQEDNQRTTERTSCGQASKEKGIRNMEYGIRSKEKGERSDRASPVVAPTSKKFSPPSLGDIMSYIEEMGYTHTSAEEEITLPK